MPECLRLADPLISITNNILYESIDSLERLPVLGLPPQIIVPSHRVPDQLFRHLRESIFVCDELVSHTVASIERFDSFKEVTGVCWGTHEVCHFLK